MVGKCTNCNVVLMGLIVLYIDVRPSQTCHSKDSGSDTFRWQLWEEIASAGLADNTGQGKIPWYSHRLMHRKRVTCELHDSYFHLMTIKHAIPKILSGRLNYYITRWRQEVSQFGDQTRWWQDAVEKARIQQSGPLGLRLSSPGERERYTAMSRGAGEVNMLQSLSSLQLPSHTNLTNKVRGIFF